MKMPACQHLVGGWQVKGDGLFGEEGFARRGAVDDNFAAGEGRGTDHDTVDGG